MVDNTYTCTHFPCLLVYCDLHGWLHQVPIYWKWPLPSPYIFLILLLSPEVHSSPVQSPRQDHHSLADHRISAAETRALLIYLENSQNQRQLNTQYPTIYLCSMHVCSRILQSIPSTVHVLTTPNFA